MALAAAAVLIPCGVWYWLGTRQLEREAKQLEQAARREAASAGDQMAARMALRLEELGERETTRPHLHYWREFRSRGETCSALEVRRSPLTQGKKDKMILAHFQIDDEGRVSSPEPWVDTSAIAFSQASINARIAGGRRETPILASVVPATLTSEPPRPDELAQVTPFRWQTGLWEGKPTLMAVRQVITVDQTYVQGFVVDNGGLSHWTFEQGFPADLLPGDSSGDTEVRVPIVGASWHITVDPRPRIQAAQVRAATLRTQFHTSYFGGMLGALLAGGCLVVLVRRSERLAEERSRFAAAAAHELRTPLAGIRLHGEMLALSLGNPARLGDYARRITDEAERLTRLVSNVFSYTQVDQRRLRINKERGDLGRAVAEALTIMQPLVEKGGASLQVRVAEDLPPVELDKDAVHQMVRNLVDNAEKYTRQTPDRRIEIDVRAAADAVELAVRDHGPGVPAPARARIFHPFARHEKNSEAGGLGLGLAVVRNLALAHGGDVAYSDAPGGGACFTVRFPIAAAG
jgi:signal transduction histidine kinase